jgi:hypothetical protein
MLDSEITWQGQKTIYKKQKNSTHQLIMGAAFLN